MLVLPKAQTPKAQRDPLRVPAKVHAPSDATQPPSSQFPRRTHQWRSCQSRLRHRLRRLQRLLLLGRWVVGTVQILSYCRYGDADARSVPSPGEAKLPNSVRSGYATHPTLLPPTAALLHHTTPHVRSEAGLFLSAFTFLQKNPPALFPALFLPFPSSLHLPLQSDAVFVSTRA